MTEASSVGSIENLMSDLEEMIRFNDDSDVDDAHLDGDESASDAEAEADADGATGFNSASSIPFQTESFHSAVADEQIDIADIDQARSAEERIEALKNASSSTSSVFDAVDGSGRNRSSWAKAPQAASFASDVVATDGATIDYDAAAADIITKTGSSSPTAPVVPQDKGDHGSDVAAEYESFAIDTGENRSFVSDEEEEENDGGDDENAQYQPYGEDQQQHQQQEKWAQNGQEEGQNEDDYDDGIDVAPTQGLVRPRLGRWFGRRTLPDPNGDVAATASESADDDDDDDIESNNESATTSSRGLGRYARQVSDSIRNLREAAAALDNIEASKIRAREAAMDPYSILTSPNCRARTLSISDHHATILLIRSTPKRQRSGRSGHSTTDDDELPGGVEEGSNDDGNDGPQILRALLKLRVAPFHKGPLGRKPMTAGDYADQSFTNEDMEASSDIVWFLSRYRFSLIANSGSEYSYYDAVPSEAPAIGQRAAGEVGLAQSLNMALHGLAGETSTARDATPGTNAGIGLGELMLGGFKVELVAPASDQQIRLEMPKPSSSLVKETPELYNTVTKPYIESIVSGDGLDWIEDIVQGKTNSNGVLFENDEYFLHIDTMWKSHPDPRTTPTEDWFEHPSISDLHIVGMLKLSGIASLRDLRGEHVPLLRSMVADGLRIIHQLYGVDSDQVRVYIPYPPHYSMYRFHIYYTRISHTEGCLVESAHLVDDVIQNLEMDSDFYTKRTIQYKVRVTDELYKRVWLNEVSSDAFALSDLDIADGDY